MRIFKIAILSVILFVAFFSYSFSGNAQYLGEGNPEEEGFQLVPCDGIDCDFNALMELLNRVISFVLYISIPLAAISFSWAGYLYLSAAGNTGQIEKAHGIFKTVLIGFIFIISGWLIVYTITHSLLSDEFLESDSNLLQEGGNGEGGGNGGGDNKGENSSELELFG